MRYLFLLLALTACSHRPLVFAPQPSPNILYGITEAGPLPPEVVDHYCSWGGMILLRTPIHSLDHALAVQYSLQRCPTLKLLLLIENKDLELVRALAGFAREFGVYGVELGNELDLDTNTRRALTEKEFATWIVQGHDILRAEDYQGLIITGGIYTVNDGHLSYLQQALNRCPDCVAGLHWYGDDSNGVMITVQQLNRLLMITETGTPACNEGRTPATQAVYVEERLRRLPQVGNVVGLMIYQGPTGLGTTDLDCFGIRGLPAELSLRASVGGAK